MIYRKCEITVDPKPMGSRNHDYEWVHADYCGPEDNLGLKLFGTGSSEEDCKQQIDELYAEAETEIERLEYEDESRSGKIWCGADR